MLQFGMRGTQMLCACRSQRAGADLGLTSCYVRFNSSAVYRMYIEPYPEVRKAHIKASDGCIKGVED